MGVTFVEVDEIRCADCGHSFNDHRRGSRGWWRYVYCVADGCVGCAKSKIMRGHRG